MGKVTIYIKKENEAKWQALESGSGWVNGLLSSQWNGIKLSEGVPTVDGVPLDTPAGRKVERKFCQHGAAIGMCKFGCKK